MKSNDKEILNILVTGANGQLGSSIRKMAENQNDNYFFTDVDTLDITDREAVEKFVAERNIGLIVNCAAFTNVDAAEDKEELAELLNGTAPGILGEVMAKKNGTLIHISTDYVFGGDKVNTPVNETCDPNPTGVYGITKLHGEQEVKKSGTNYVIIRTSWLYSEYGGNFMKKILELLSKRDEIKVVFDQCGTPTYAGDLAKAIVEIISTRQFQTNPGIYHFSNEGVCSWYDFADAIYHQSGLKGKKVLPCHSDEFPSKVIRPPYSVMDKTKIKETFGIKIPHWHESLKECLRQVGNSE